MDAPLAQCTREEQRAVVRFLWSEGSSGTKIHQRLLAQYGDNALSKTTVYEWIEKFKTGWTSVKHAEGAGRPSTSTSEEKIEQAQQMILANRRITIDEVAQSLQISFGSAQEIIHEILGYNKVWPQKSDHSTLFFSGALCQWSVHFYQQKITRVKTERTIRLADRDHVTQ